MTQNQIAYHNAKELERHNKMSEQETQRHQMMTEALQRWSNALTNYQIAVNKAHYERVDAETERANRARENQNALGIYENQRSNLVNEQIKDVANRINQASIAETSRHQRIMENLQDSLNKSQITRNEAEASYATGNTAYIQSKTATENYARTIIMPTQNQETAARAGYYSQKADTEPSVRFNNMMQGMSSGINAISGAFRTVTSLINPVSTMTEGQQIFSQFNKMLK